MLASAANHLPAKCLLNV